MIGVSMRVTPKRILRPARRAVAEFIYHYRGERNHQGLGNAFVFLDTTGIIKARRICCCSQPATSYLSPSARYAPVNGLAGYYVSTIGSRMSILTSRARYPL